MRPANALLVLLALAGCAGDKKEGRAAETPAASKTTSAASGTAPAPVADTPAAAPAEGGRGSGTLSVKGGEVIPLAGAKVTVKRVSYLNQPCPKDVQCVHSGVVHSVQFAVERDGKTEETFVDLDHPKVVQGVMLRVQSVEEGPVATVDVSLPVVPKAN
jgi:hypothetical protein